MKKQLFSLLMLFFVIFQTNSQTNALWKQHNKTDVLVSKNVQRASFPTDFDLYQLNFQFMKNLLATAQDRFVASTGVLITLPNKKGELEQFEVFEASNFDAALQMQYPEIRAYVGKSLSDNKALLRMSISPAGIQTMVFRSGGNNEFMEPYSEESSVYALYNSSRIKGETSFICSTQEEKTLGKTLSNKLQSPQSNTGELKVFRLALSCTGEYGTYFGGTVAGALAQMNATMTRVNGVFEKDLAIRMNIIASNTSVIYTNASTDPYATASGNSVPSSWNGELQTTLTSIIGESNYDIGHLFGASGGGGNAGCIGCVCVDGSKGSGITSPGSGPAMGDNFDIDYVAHEMGHQFGGNHTFSFSTEDNAVNVEPGSGSTIMAYAGITGETDVQPHSDDFFAYRSILQIQTNLNGKTCPITTTLTNLTPDANAGQDWTIPMGTPFVLTGVGTDSPSDVLSYVWEQNDDATNISSNATTSAANSFPSGTKTNGPNFRSFVPNPSPVRYFPSLSNLATNNLTWEKVSTVARTLNFVFTVRDNVLNGGQTNTDDTVVTVSTASGPFEVTSQSTDGISWAQGTTQNITWNVNNTNTLPGSSSVSILLSTDGGLTYPTVLASSTPNDGSEAITVPNIAAPYCRIMIKPTGHVFFNINPKTFAIGYVVTSTTTCTDYVRVFNPPVAIPTGWTGYGIVIPDSYTISDANVKIVSTAARTSQLSFGLGKPGTGVVDVPLFAGGGCGFGVANLNAVFDDEGAVFSCAATNVGAAYQPTSSLTSTDGMNSAGTWLIAAKSTLATNTLNSATITLCKTETSTVLTTNDFGLAEFNLYPNPSKGNFTVQFNSATSSNSIALMVHDLGGRLIYKNTFTNTGLFSQNIQLDKVQTGVYLVTVQDGENKVVKRIVIE